jgi:PTS system cellobiose-specific IIB component
MKILVVCGAGASSTFVARRINIAAQARRLPWAALATNESWLAGKIPGSDLVLIGPHLAPRSQQIKDEAATHGVAVVLLDADVFADLDGSRTLARIEAAVADGTVSPSPATP